MPEPYDQPRQSRGRPEYRTRYSDISAHDGAYQANYNSAGDRRSYRSRSFSRDQTHRNSKRSRKHGGNIFTLINVSHNSILGPSRSRSCSAPPNRRLSVCSNDGLEQHDGTGRWVDKEVVRIEETEITTGKRRREKHWPRATHLDDLDTPDNRKRNGKGVKTGLMVTALTAIVSVFVIANSRPKRSPPSQVSRSRSSQLYRDHSSCEYQPRPHWEATNVA
jgi:hypothetical protein